jgi:hypothetical protein
MTTQLPAPLATRRRTLFGVALAVVVAVAAGLFLLLGGTENGAPTPAAEPTSGPAPTSDAPSSPAPAAPAGPTEIVDAPPPTLAPVGLDQVAEVGNGITARVRQVEAVDGQGYGPGNIPGPALRITVHIDNGTAEPVSLDGVAVSLTYGPDATPGSPLDDPSRAPFSGTVDAGASAEGTYVFTVPRDQRDRIVVSVGYQAGAPVLVFTGPAD